MILNTLISEILKRKNKLGTISCIIVRNILQTYTRKYRIGRLLKLEYSMIQMVRTVTLTKHWSEMILPSDTVGNQEIHILNIHAKKTEELKPLYYRIKNLIPMLIVWLEPLLNLNLQPNIYAIYTALLHTYI